MTMTDGIRIASIAALLGMFAAACSSSGPSGTSTTTNSAGSSTSSSTASSSAGSSTSTGTTGAATSSSTSTGTTSGTATAGSTSGSTSAGPTTGSGTTGSAGTSGGSTGTSGGTTGGTTGPFVPYDAGPRFQASIDYDAGCTALAPRFDSSFGSCVQCKKGTDCAPGLVCDTNVNNSLLAQVCVQCTNSSNCDAGEVCNAAVANANLWQGNDQCQADCRTNPGTCRQGYCDDAGLCYDTAHGYNYTDFDNCGNQVDAGWCLSGSDCQVNGAGGACNLASQLCPFNVSNGFCNSFNGLGNGLGYCVPCTVDAGGCASPDEFCVSTGCDGPAGSCVFDCFRDAGSCGPDTYCADAGPIGWDGGPVGICNAGCKNASNCSGMTPNCSSGSCVQCVIAADCPDWAPVCQNNRCSNNCSQNSDCPVTEQCSGNVCSCSTASDCPLELPSCIGQSSGYDGTCGCTDSSQCASGQGGQVCEMRYPYATEGSGGSFGGVCVLACATTADCSTIFPGAGTVCDTTTSYCVPCAVDQDCIAAADPLQPIVAPACILFGDGGYPNTSPPLLTGGGSCGCSDIAQCNGGYTCINPGISGTCVPPCGYQGGIDSCYLFYFSFGGYCPQDSITPYCNTFTGVCQQCLDDYDCISMCGVSQCDGGLCI